MAAYQALQYCSCLSRTLQPARSPVDRPTPAARWRAADQDKAQWPLPVCPGRHRSSLEVLTAVLPGSPPAQPPRMLPERSPWPRQGVSLRMVTQSLMQEVVLSMEELEPTSAHRPPTSPELPTGRLFSYANPFFPEFKSRRGFVTLSAASAHLCQSAGHDRQWYFNLRQLIRIRYYPLVEAPAHFRWAPYLRLQLGNRIISSWLNCSKFSCRPVSLQRQTCNCERQHCLTVP